MVEDNFKLLEDRIRRAAERLKELQSETRSLRGGVLSHGFSFRE